MYSSSICQDIDKANELLIKYTEGKHQDIISSSTPGKIVDTENISNKIALGNIADKISDVAMCLRNNFELNKKHNSDLAKLYVELSITVMDIKAFGRGKHQDKKEHDTYQVINKDTGDILPKINEEIYYVSKQTYKRFGAI